MLNKLLLAIVGLCAVALIVLYGAYEQKRQEVSYVEKVAVEQTQNQPNPSQNTAQALDPQVIDSLKKLKPGILTNSILKNTYTGTISRIDTKGGTLAWANNFAYKASIQLDNAQKNTNTFYYSESEVALMRISVGSLPIKLSDLKVGDNVTIEEELDLTRGWENNIVSLAIRKL